MATQLDQKIEQLENIVEKHLDLCKVMCNGIRCVLPRNHGRTEPHKFPIQFLETQRAVRAFIEEICNGEWIIGGPARTNGALHALAAGEK